MTGPSIQRPGRAWWPAVPAGLCLLAACAGGGNNGGLDLNSFRAADVVIGQVDFSGGSANQGGAAGADTLDSPTGAPAMGSLYLADRLNNRVLGFNAVPTDNDASADFVLGQADFTGRMSGTGASLFSNPSKTVTADGRLFVADTGNNRVLIWNALPTGNVPADVVVGAPDFTSSPGGGSRTTMQSPSGLAVAGGRLFVGDRDNNRVLVWNSIPTANGAPADLVLGQANFTDNASGLSRTALNHPYGVWSDGTRLAVADTLNNRVLVWSTLPTTNGAPADLEIGQPSFVTGTSGAGAQGLKAPIDVDCNGSQLFVADYSNNRVLVYNAFPTLSRPFANVVLGQLGFSNVAPNDDNQDGADDGVPSARTLSNPAAVFAVGDRLFVTDARNNRVLIFRGG